MLHVWHIYLQNWSFFRANVGKYSSTMEHLGYYISWYYKKNATESWRTPQFNPPCPGLLRRLPPLCHCGSRWQSWHPVPPACCPRPTKGPMGTGHWCATYYQDVTNHLC